jgi:carboxymethylenebutenolidase
MRRAFPIRAPLDASLSPNSTAMKHFLLSAAALALVCSVSAQEWAKQGWATARLEKTPRHLEWVTVKQGSRDVKAFLGFPESRNKVTAVILIHENRGLTDWVRGMVDQVAEAGYIAIAPDLLSGSGPNGGGTAEIKSNDDAGKAISALSPEQVTADLTAIVAHVSKLPACNGKVVVAGFCWGGGQTFRFATNNKEMKAGLVFYGPPPSNEADYAKISAPIYGFYGGTDVRINATLAKTEELMKAAGKKFEPVIYEGAGHAFMRSGEDPGNTTEANKTARDEAWKRIKAILAKI